MKKPNLVYPLLLVLAFASCKKNNPAKPEIKPVAITAIRDSVSYNINGKTYASDANPISNLITGSAEVNRKLVNYSDGSYALVGSGGRDSISFYQRNTISSKGANIAMYFVKKTIKAKNGAPLPKLNEQLPSFAVGKHPFAEDFQWQNTQNGIAFAISTDNGNYTSYNGYDRGNPIVIKPGFQNNSTFEVLSFEKASQGGYNLKAKFTAVVIDNTTGQLKKLDNGYIQLNFVPIVANDDN